jgi:hypothetical protein
MKNRKALPAPLARSIAAGAQPKTARREFQAFFDFKTSAITDQSAIASSKGGSGI